MRNRILHKIKKILFSQRSPKIHPRSVDELIRYYLESHNTKNCLLLQDCFYQDADIVSVFNNQTYRKRSVINFVSEHEKIFHNAKVVSEEFQNPMIKHFQNMAMFEADYTYQIDSEKSSGRDFMILVHADNAWRIMSLVLTTNR